MTYVKQIKFGSFINSLLFANKVIRSSQRQSFFGTFSFADLLSTMHTKLILIVAIFGFFSNAKSSVFFRNVIVDSVSWSLAMPTLASKIM